MSQIHKDFLIAIAIAPLATIVAVGAIGGVLIGAAGFPIVVREAAIVAYPAAAVFAVPTFLLIRTRALRFRHVLAMAMAIRAVALELSTHQPFLGAVVIAMIGAFGGAIFAGAFWVILKVE